MILAHSTDVIFQNVQGLFFFHSYLILCVLCHNDSRKTRWTELLFSPNRAGQFIGDGLDMRLLVLLRPGHHQEVSLVG